MVDSFTTSVSGLRAQSTRIANAANNIANATTSGAVDPEDGPPSFTPQDTVLVSQEGGVLARNLDRDPPNSVQFNPSSPFANEEGLISVPNVNLASELVEVKTAEIAYRANLEALETQFEVENTLLDIFT